MPRDEILCIELTRAEIEQIVFPTKLLEWKGEDGDEALEAAMRDIEVRKSALRKLEEALR